MSSARSRPVSLNGSTRAPRVARNPAARGALVEPFKLTGLDRALDIWWFFFGPLVAHLFRPTVEGHISEMSPIFREYLAFAAPEHPVTLDEVIENCAQRDLVRAE